MNRPPRHRRKAWRKSKPSSVGYKPPWAGRFRLRDEPSLKLSRSERISQVGLVVLGCVTFVVILHFFMSWESKRHMNDFVNALRVNYRLNEDQVVAIRKIESEFHGMGGIFFRSSWSSQEEVAHQIEISRQMSPETGRSFLADLKRNSSVVGKRMH